MTRLVFFPIIFACITTHQQDLLYHKLLLFLLYSSSMYALFSGIIWTGGDELVRSAN